MLTLAWILAIGLAGPLLALPKRFRVPVAVGEILIGVIFCSSGLRKVPLHNSSFELIADIGFALVMMIAGSHIDLARIAGHRLLRRALKRQAIVFAAGIPLAFLTAKITHMGHAPIFFVLMTSSSAALVLPIFAGQKTAVAGDEIATMLTQVAVADLLAVLALPLVMDTRHLPRLVAGSSLIVVSTAILFFLVRVTNRDGRLERMRRVSKTNHFGLELRISLILLLALAGMAKQFHISVMVAGFAIGLVLASNGMPHRLARQLFAVAEGFFAPFFFVWLGAKIDIRDAFKDQHLLLLAALLGAGAVLAHLATLITRQPIPLAVTASAQLGVPVAAVTIGQSTGVFSAGQGGAIMLAALITIVATLVSTSRSTV